MARGLAPKNIRFFVAGRCFSWRGQRSEVRTMPTARTGSAGERTVFKSDHPYVRLSNRASVTISNFQRTYRHCGTKAFQHLFG